MQFVSEAGQALARKVLLVSPIHMRPILESISPRRAVIERHLAIRNIRESECHKM